MCPRSRLDLILLLVVFGVWPEKRAVRLLKTELIARGATLELNDLIPPYSVESHQAAIELTAAA